VFLLSTLLVAVPNVLQAAPIVHRSINKSLKDFPEQTDLSTPESALAALERAMALKDIESMLDVYWVKLDFQAAATAIRDLPAAMAKKRLDMKVVKVLSYRNDLAAVIVTSTLSPSEQPYAVLHFGRIDGKWKIITVDWRTIKDLTYSSPTIEAAEERFTREKEELWRFFKQVRADVQSGRTASQLSAKQLEEIKRMQAMTWAVNIRLDLPTLEPQALQYTILDKDPALAYAAEIRKMQKFNRQQLQQADTKEWKEVVRSAQMEVAWNHAGFRDVTGDNLSLLTQPGHFVTASLATVEKKRRVTTDSTKTTPRVSNAPGGKKWVVTKTVRIEGQPVCWSIPIEVKTGQQATVTFNKGNTFDLQTPYDKTMKQSVDHTDVKEGK
jgi:hypothetical protein